nr:hypothetical protein [Tanacetum cinerariifolium]
VDGIDEGNGNDEVGSGVYIGNGIRSGDNVYDVSDIGDSGGVDILTATRYPNGGSVATLLPSSKGSVSSDSETELYRAGAGTVGASIIISSASRPSFSSGSISGSDSVMYPGDSAVGDTAVGSGCSSAGSISSAGGRYYRYSGPGM